MSATKEEVIKIYSRVQISRNYVESLTRAKKACHEVIDFVLRLRAYPSLWPRSFNADTFVELETEMALADAAIGLAAAALTTMEQHAKDCANLQQQSTLMLQIGLRATPSISGQTLEQMFAANLAEVEVAAQDILLLHEEAYRHIDPLEKLLT